MSNSAQKDNKSSAAKTEASKPRAAARMPPGAALPQMAPPPELVALQRVMQGHVATEPPVQRQEVEGSSNQTGLPDGLKAGVERLSGVSLDDVRVHYNSDKPAQVGAHAYTKGTEIHVGPGQESSVPHEAWHAVQQLQGRVEPTVQFAGNVPGNADKGLEDEADRMGARALDMSRQELDQTDSLSQGNIATSVVQRDGDDDVEGPEAPQELGAQDEQQVDISSVKPEQKETIEQLFESLRRVPAAEFAEAIPMQEERSTQLWAIKFRSYDPDFMKLIMDTDLGMDLADELIRAPKNPIPNYLSIINHVNLAAIIPTKLGDLVQALVVTLPHAIISGVLNAIPSFAGYFMASNPFFAAAIHGRYGVNINASQWTSQEMRNLWNSFKKVPRKHILGKVTDLERSNTLESSYSGGKIKMSKLIPQSISMGGAENAQRLLTKFLMKRSKYSDRMRSKNAFTMTTLHEVGHAVDAKLGLMTKYGSRREFGGWVKNVTPDVIFNKWAQTKNIGNVVYSPETQQLRANADAEEQRHSGVVREVGNATEKARAQVRKALDAKNAAKQAWLTSANRDEDWHWEGRIGIPKSIFDKLGSTIAKGQSIEPMVNEYLPVMSDMSKAVQSSQKQRRSRMIAAINHLPPTRMVKHGRLKEMTMGFGWNVERATGRNLAAAFGGKMFHEAYENDWVGYDIEAKNDGVSHYQFRAPGEFFAELYAHYYLDTLSNKDKSQKHPLYDFIEKAVAENPECSPEKMVEGATATIDKGQLQEQGVRVPVPQQAVVLEQVNEEHAPERPSLDQQPAPENQEKPKDQNSD